MKGQKQIYELMIVATGLFQKETVPSKLLRRVIKDSRNTRHALKYHPQGNCFEVSLLL